MSTSDFIKGSCQQCGGHLEFPADSAGSTITCPHCGWSTLLEGPAKAPVQPAKPSENAGRPGRGWMLLGLAVLLVVAGLAGAYIYWQKGSAGGGIAPGPAPAKPASVLVQTNKPVAAPQPHIQAQTNEFAILPYKLEKMSGSSLVYVTGTVRNTSDHQRFGVKVVFSLFDTNENAVGTASDYQAVLDPKGEWKFKAMVLESKAVTAKFSSIAETQ
jgi:hypothetical protein